MITCTFEKGHTASLRHVVVHALCVKDNSILLVRRVPELLEGGKWSLPGGFLDRDETFKEGVLRELKEETGWEGEIRMLFHITSDPNRPHEDRQNIAVSYVVKPAHPSGTPDKESTQIEWISLDDLPPKEDIAFDHGEIIALYVKYLRSPFPLPIVV
jgi:8-oxo-dGTP diphosphatase